MHFCVHLIQFPVEWARDYEDLRRELQRCQFCRHQASWCRFVEHDLERVNGFGPLLRQFRVVMPLIEGDGVDLRASTIVHQFPDELLPMGFRVFFESLQGVCDELLDVIE